jgi:hypothetical protein
MRYFVRFLFLSLMFWLSACGGQPYLQQNSAFIVLKTPAMRYADQGFVYENPDEVKAEIYGSGQALFSLRMARDRICSGQFACMSPERFNAQMLSAYYPDDTISRIFRGKPIFDAKGLHKKRNGFTQKLINGDKYRIEYTVLNNETVFRDTINHILIKIKRL